MADISFEKQAPPPNPVSIRDGEGEYPASPSPNLEWRAEGEVNGARKNGNLPPWLISLLRGFLIVAFPAFFVLTGVRLVATETFLQIEYHRPGFPADRFGFSTSERLQYAPYAIEYLRNDAGIEYLGDLTFENGMPLFNARELRHMEDVKIVTQTSFTVHAILSVLYIGVILVLAWSRETRPALRQGLSGGGFFTILLIITLVVLIFANWDFFFDNFHAIFFEGDSWQFSTSDTLIRLFPEQFWFDAAMTIGAFTVAASLIAIIGVWVWNGAVNGPVPDSHDQNGSEITL